MASIDPFRMMEFSLKADENAQSMKLSEGYMKMQEFRQFMELMNNLHVPIGIKDLNEGLALFNAYKAGKDLVTPAAPASPTAPIKP